MASLIALASMIATAVAIATQTSSIATLTVPGGWATFPMLRGSLIAATSSVSTIAATSQCPISSRFISDCDRGSPFTLIGGPSTFHMHTTRSSLIADLGCTFSTDGALCSEIFTGYFPMTFSYGLTGVQSITSASTTWWAPVSFQQIPITLTAGPSNNKNVETATAASSSTAIPGGFASSASSATNTDTSFSPAASAKAVNNARSLNSNAAVTVVVAGFCAILTLLI